jgi:potassium uptake TrkH family protein
MEYFFDVHDSRHISEIMLILVQLYFFLTIFIEISHIGDFLGKIKIKPGGLLVLSFLILISIGTLLLMMPEMTVSGISFIDAVFTSTSACCVTGLTSVDTATVFTSKGWFVLMLLIQLGGINIICFASFLSNFYSGGSLRYQSVLKEMLDTSLEGTRSFTLEIVSFTFGFELIGFLLLFVYLNMTGDYSASWLDNAFLSAFHAISSFNNAGFSFLPNAMMHSLILNSYYIQTVTILLIVSGGIGFLTIHDLVFSIYKRRKWHNLHTTTRVVLKMTGILIAIGAVSFFILEYNNVCKGMNLVDRIYASVFSSITCRTAGYNTVDFGAIHISTLLLIVVFMVIGAAPGSTGGGIKVTTFYLLLKAAVATITGKQQVTMCNRAIPFNVVNKAYATLLFAIAVIFIGTFILTLTEPFDLEDILFEVASAFGTTGLSAGITPYLSVFAKSIIITIMYLGRITVLTFAFSITRRAFARYSLARTDMGI